jgi:YHS domain-containing protein
MAICPVCRSAIDETAARAQTGQTAYGAAEVDPAWGTRRFHNGQWYYFDTLACRNKFLVRPEAYLKQGAAPG